MKRKLTVFLFGTMLTLALTGCQNNNSEEKSAGASTTAEDTAKDAAADADDSAADDTVEDTDASAADDTVEDTDASAANNAAEDTDTSADADDVSDEAEEISSEEEQTEASLAPITPSDYLISDAADYVKLGSYDAIPVEMTTYEITDDMVQERIQEELEYNASEVEKDGGAESDDIIYGTLSYTVEGTDETVTDDEFYITVGYEEYGVQFDQEILGASAGDTLSFSVKYTEDDMIIDWEGKTVDFTLDVSSVCALDVPEYDDEYVKNYTDYDSKEDYESYIQLTLEQEYEDMSYSDTIDSLFGAALDRTEFTGYPQELYDECKEETLDFYRMFVGDGTADEICEALGIDAEDLDADVLSTVNQKLLVSAYCLANDITVTEEEYISFIESYAEYYGEADAASFEDSYGRESLVWSLYDSKFTEALYENAEITEVAYDPEAYETEYFEPEELDISAVEDETEMLSEAVTE